MPPKLSPLDHILPIYHPTKVIFVDDQPAWLNALSILLPEDLSFECFDNQKKALQEINFPKNDMASPFSNYKNSEFPLKNSHTINFDLDFFSKVLSNKNRFSDTSVVVFDYHMPGMNGLEFCQNIENRNIRRIMITGAVDENLAVEAFNAGIIDGFIKKHDDHFLEKLLPIIRTAQRNYFHLSSTSIDSLKGIRLQFLHDENFIKLFKTLCQERGIVEHYVTANPDGILMLDLEANITLLAIFTLDDLKSQYEVACDQHAPDYLLSALESQQFGFWHGLDGFYTDQCIDWISSLYPIHRIPGNSDLFYTLIESWPKIEQLDILPYQEYLDFDQDALRCA